MMEDLVMSIESELIRTKKIEQNSKYSITLKRINDNWIDNFNELKNYLSENKDLTPSLKQWSYYQKIKYKSNQLNEEKQKLLESCPNWTWDSKTRNMYKYNYPQTSKKRNINEVQNEVENKKIKLY